MFYVSILYKLSFPPKLKLSYLFNPHVKRMTEHFMTLRRRVLQDPTSGIRIPAPRSFCACGGQS